MKYEFRFYTKDYYEDMLELALKSYAWEIPVVGVSRIEFANSLGKRFTGSMTAWEKTIGCYFEKDKLVACTWNEGNYEGESFFLFDSKERAEEEELLCDMIKVSKTYGAGYKEDRRTRYVDLFIPEWNKTLQKLACEHGFEKGGWTEHLNILPFGTEKFEVKLPEGYSIIDGKQSPDFFWANVHRHSFGYGGEDRACEHGQEAFAALRRERDYHPEFDLCVLDGEKRPVACANIWYNEDMSYCELEPLAVCWWERRKGIGTAILHEAANRIMSAYPKCKGMLGGDQPFYKSIGYEAKAQATAYHWEAQIYISWEPESADKYYGGEV